MVKNINHWMPKAFSGCFFFLLIATASGQYDPLDVANIKIDSKDIEVTDPKRNREIPLKIYLPKDTTAAPVILFSHDWEALVTTIPI